MKEAEIKVLLTETFIEPDREEVLFELYWVIQLIKHNSENARLHLVDGSNHKVASWERAGLQFDLYHDSTGSSKLQFYVGLDEVANSTNSYLKRKVSSIRSSQQLASDFFGGEKNETSIWSGRPDLLLEIRKKETGELVKVIIGEVKYTNRTEYATTGLRELVDYVTLMKDDQGTYVDKSIPVEGILFLDQVKVKETSSSSVRVVSMLSGEGLRI